MTTIDPSVSRVAGPVDRVHFLDEQRRHRRSSWRFSALAVFGVLVTGVPVCVIATPIVFTIVLVIGYIVDVFVTLPPSVWTALQGLAFAIPNAANTIDGGAAQSEWIAMAFGIAILVLPGALALLAIWFAVRAILGRVGVGGLLQRIGARELKARDLEEQQLANLVQEMAIAGGVLPPRVMMLDSDAVNAAATGLEMSDATILVTRGLLDKLDRDQTQAVIAHLIGSIGNGDLRIASTIFSIYQTWGALTLLMQMPFGPKSRKTIRRALRVAFGSRKRVVDQWEAEFVSDALLASSGVNDDSDDLDQFMKTKDGREPNDFQKLLRAPLFITLGLGSLVVKFAVFVSSMVLIGPIISFMWRTRRYLADAMAVQLTRNPDALVSALQQMVRLKSEVAGGGTLAFLFVSWPKSTSSDGAVVGQFTGMHPKVHKRQRRLQAQGATNVSNVQARASWPLKQKLAAAALMLVIGPLLATALVLSIFLIVMLTMLTLMIMMVAMFAVWGLLKLIFVTAPGWFR